MKDISNVCAFQVAIDVLSFKFRLVQMQDLSDLGSYRCRLFQTYVISDQVYFQMKNILTFRLFWIKDLSDAF